MSDDRFDLSGKVALITGGSRGLGKEMALAFADAGADLVITSRKIDSCEDVARAIRDMVVRGAPAIGIAAAFGAVLAARAGNGGAQGKADFDALLEELAAARPTAVNLHWAINAMRTEAVAAVAAGADVASRLEAAAERVFAADIANNRLMGAHGAAHIARGSSVMTHCNAGALATGGYGTALGVIRSACASGRINNVYAGETRPWFQGARLTAWELLNDGIDVTLVAEGAAAWLMQSGRVDWVITGADRVAANGDVANKIGTLNLATLARAYGVRMMVVAPLSTIDLGTADGAAIPIEHRAAEELTHHDGAPIAAPGVAVLNPVFDVTPAALVDVLVTEKRAVEAPDRARIEALFEA